MVKRLLPVVGILGLLSVVLAGSAAAGGSGGYGVPGKFTFTDWSANANFYDPSGANYSSSVYVDRGTQSFKQKHTPGAPVVELPGTILSVNEQSATTQEYGCWIIPDSAFVIASDLSSASVNVHATADMQCPGFYVSGATGGKPQLQSAIGYGGGGPPPTRITDIIVNLTWTGSGAAWNNKNSGSSKCQGYSLTFRGTFDYEYSTATGTVGDLSASSDPLAQVAHNTQTTNQNGMPSAACNPYGF